MAVAGSVMQQRWSTPFSVLGAALLALAGAGARADDAPLANELPDATERAIAAGLDRLVALQQQTGEFARTGDSYTVAATSLGGLALLASGSTYDRGERAHAVKNAVHYLLNAALSRPQPDQVFFERPGDAQGKMHAHGFAVLFLAEAYGMADQKDRDIADALRGAIRASLSAQTETGGWGYYLPSERDFGQDEASVTITQIEALRACRNAGLFVPADRIQRAVDYVRRSMTADGSCRYSLTMGGVEANRTSFELTAAAVATLHASGVYDSPELVRGLNFLRRTLRRYDSPGKAATDFYFYGNFYAAQAMFQAGGDDWAGWWPGMRRELLSKQKPDGGWESQRNFGEAYATASALLILQIPKRLLPIFSR
jgi:squalene cyclase